MKKTIRYFCVVAATLLTLLTACEQDHTEPVAVSDCPTFSALIDGLHTRASDDTWENGDKIGISGGKFSNVCHVAEFIDSLLFFTVENPEQQIYFQGSNKVVFTGYYPYSSQEASTGLINISTEDQTQQRNFDFLWASAEGSRTESEVKLKFAHKMSKVTFIFENGKDMDVSAINKIRVNGLVVEGSFNTITGVCGIASEAPTAPISMILTDVMNGQSVTPLLLIPQTIETGSVKLEIYDSNSQYFVCNLTIPDKELLAGTNYNYTITVNKTGLKVNSCTLSDWITENGEDSEASSTDD